MFPTLLADGIGSPFLNEAGHLFSCVGAVTDKPSNPAEVQEPCPYIG
jgi:hypothetical protein